MIRTGSGACCAMVLSRRYQQYFQASVVCLVVLFSCTVDCVIYSVGNFSISDGKYNWLDPFAFDFSPDLYQNWADSIDFQSTDTLVFTYDPTLHSVIVVPTEEMFDTCTYSTTNYLYYSRNETSFASLINPYSGISGYWYVFSTWTSTDCADGMKFKIFINGNTQPGTPPAAPASVAPVAAPAAPATPATPATSTSPGASPSLLSPPPPAIGGGNPTITLAPTNETPLQVLTITWEPQANASWASQYTQLNLTVNSVVFFNITAPDTVVRVSDATAYQDCDASKLVTHGGSYSSFQRVDLSSGPGDYFFIDKTYDNCESRNMKIILTVHGAANSGSSSKSHLAVIVGALVVVIVLVLVGVCIAVCCCRRWTTQERERKERDRKLRTILSTGGSANNSTNFSNNNSNSNNNSTNNSKGGSSSNLRSFPGDNNGGSLSQWVRSKEAINAILAGHKGNSCKIFSFDELERASDNFSKANELGSGGFGTVYKGTLDDGTIVAIKRTKNGATDIEQFINEVSILSQVNNRNLVKLLGCCVDLNVPLLVYEFISNGSVHDHLLQAREGYRTKLDWPMRFKIAVQTADALKYLHFQATPPIFHRDVKTANILLDESFNAKVADFGLSKLVDMEATHVSTAVKGTPGYLDPEYYHNFQLTDKTDVYSFGVVLLELITSKKPVDVAQVAGQQNLAVSCIPVIRSGKTREIIDKNLITRATSQQDFKVIEGVALIAVACLGTERAVRPSMNEVVDMLSKLKGTTAPNASHFFGMQNDRAAEMEMQKQEGYNYLFSQGQGNSGSGSSSYSYSNSYSNSNSNSNSNSYSNSNSSGKAAADMSREMASHMYPR